MTTPQPGVYPKCPFGEYRAWDAMSQSTLKMCGISPKHMRCVMDGKTKPPSDALRFGAAFHSFILEPDEFAASYLVATPCMQELKSGPRKGKPCGATATHVAGIDDDARWLCGTHAKGCDAVTPDRFVQPAELERMSKMRQSLRQLDICKLLQRVGGVETSILAMMDGLPVKCRLDKVASAVKKRPCIVDMKKVAGEAITERDLRRAIRDRGYDYQAAWYTDVFAHVTGEEPLFLWLFCEDSEPYDVAPVFATRDMVALGRTKYLRHWHTYKQCLEHDIWPGVTAGGEFVFEPEDWEVKRTPLSMLEIS